MTHRFPIKEIARQAGLGTATVDRTLNNRAHVSPQTKARVAAAIGELEAMEAQLAARGRRMFVDVVVEAPQRFSNQIRAACEAVLPDLVEAVYRPRFRFQEVMTEDELLSRFARIKKRGSQGVVLKARDNALVVDAVNDLVRCGIPVATLVTDIPGSNRCAYVGIDNDKAGRTAAYLMARILGDQPATILTSRSQKDFQGEEVRLVSFRNQLNLIRPGDTVLELVGGAGLERQTKLHLDRVISAPTQIHAVYSMGGGNRAILGALAEVNSPRPQFIAHDLDAENLALLRGGSVGFVLHHDLLQDMRRAFRALSIEHGLLSPQALPPSSDIQIVTPENIPRLRQASPDRRH
ncbi:MAG: LacI family DNA-binding transcriptional regulator [Pseudomonadota bacterium]